MFWRLLPLRDWGYIALMLTVVALGALFVHHERELGAHAVRAAVAEAAASAAQANAAESARRVTEIQEVTRDAQRSSAQLAVNLAAAAGQRHDIDGLLDALVRRGATTGNPATAGGSSPADAASQLLADLYRGADEAAGIYAAEADRRGTAGSACERSYDALTTTTP
jgi:hypothetical protein